MNHEETVKIDDALAEYLQKQEAGEPADREALLAAYPEHADEIREFLSDLGHFEGLTGPPDNALEQPDSRIGRYELREQIGKGGFGVVYRAEQFEPVRRFVALKILKPGMDSEEVIGRFEAERQALALMEHPNIATVLDAGTTEAGRPYFVMELVKGVPITEYCDRCNLTTRDRLQLFRNVCQAVQHAHQKGVIHRDIKPSNVLVAMQDGKPVPKVIDFGIAKAIDQRLSEQTVVTAFAQMIGTPLYMSPEQAEMSQLDIDTRCDVYALGVLLYELLTGTTPFSKEQLKSASFDELRRLIREVEPPRPSDRMSTLGQHLSTVAEHRRTEPRKLRQMFRGDLDWIVMKALEKDRTRRYATANGLAEDVRRFLEDEPVQACPPSRAYRVKKFVRRNRVAVVTVGLVTLSLFIGAGLAVWQAVRATNSEHDALVALGEKDRALTAESAARSRAETAAIAERTAKGQAQKRLKQIAKGNDILGLVFESLDPIEIAQADRPLQEILVEKLDKAIEQLEGEAIGDPLVVVAMQNKLGLSLINLGEPNKAIVLLEKARATPQLDPNHPLMLTTMHNLGAAYQSAGQLKLAVPLLEETLKRSRRLRGTGHLATVKAMNELAVTYVKAGKLNQALPLLEETYRRRMKLSGPLHVATLRCMNNLASAYREAGDLKRALAFAKKALKDVKENLPANHPYRFCVHE